MPQTRDRRQIYPTYSKNQINSAAERIGTSLETGELIKEDEKIVENWRASHTHILNTWQVILRQRIKNSSSNNIYFAQRLKRKNTIYNKLKRYPKMKLTRMHDIAGCRLIFRSEEDMRDYIENLHKSKGFKHIIKEDQCKDYISNPKSSGYRGIHDVYAYQSKKGYDRSDKWNGLLVEIQYRTIYQHAWATAVEIADYLTNSHTKFSQGDEDQQEFFRCASEIIARVYENKKSCKSDVSNAQLLEQFNSLEKKTKLLNKLKKINTLKKKPKIFQHNLVIHFTMEQEKPVYNIDGFRSLVKANKLYFEMEKKYPNDDIVLVKSIDKKSILETFKNYFADAKDFTEYIDEGIKRLSTPLK